MGVLTILISWSVYLFYISPTIYWRDSAEFVTAGYTLAVPHPAGSPTYSLIAKLFTFIPAGNIAFRVNLVSAFFGAFSVYLLYRVTAALILKIWPGEDNRLSQYSSFASAMLYLFSATFWRFSEVAEVYTQQIFWLLLVIFLLLRAEEGQTERGKYLSLAALFYGLSAGTHAVMVFYLPAILLYLFFVDKSVLTEARKLCPLIFFLFLGLGVYMYVPIRSSADPWLNWGNPQSAKKLLYHLIDKKDAATHFALRAHNLGFQLKNYVVMLPKQLSYFGLALTVIGFVTHLKMKKTWCLLFLIFFIHWAFFVRTWDADFGFIPTFTIMTLWAGIGLHRLVTFLHTRYPVPAIVPPLVERPAPRGARPCKGQWSRPAVLLYLLMGMAVASSFVANKPYADKSGYYSTDRFGKYLLQSVEYKGLLLDQFAWFQTLYLQAVENSRPDVSSVLRNAFLAPEVFYGVNNDKFPLLVIPEREKESSPYSFMMDTVDRNVRRLPVYWYQIDKLAPLKRMVPRGIIFQVLPEGIEPGEMELNEHVEKLYQFMQVEFDDTYFWKDEEGRKVYSLNLTGLAMYFLENRLVPHSELMQRLAYQVDPASPSVVNNYGVLYEYLGRFKEAEEMYGRALALDPGDLSIRSNLGVSLYKQGEDAKAREQFNRVLKVDPYDQTANYHLGLIGIEEGDKGEFVRRMAMAIQDNPRSKLGLRAVELLRKFRTGELKIPREQ